MTIQMGWRTRFRIWRPRCTSVWRRRHACSCPARPRVEVAPRVMEVDVVERRPRDRHRPDVDTGAVEGGEYPGHGTGTVPRHVRVRGDRRRPLRGRRATRGRASGPRAPSPLSRARPPPHPRAGRAFSLGGAVRDDLPRETIATRVGEPVGLLQVVGGQQDRQALARARGGASSVHMAARASGSSPVVGSSRKSTRGR